MADWNSPPTEEEKAAAADPWSAPPTEDELAAAGAPPPEEFSVTPSHSPPPKVGKGETFVNRAVGTIPLAGPLANAISTGILQADTAGWLGPWGTSKGVQLAPRVQAEAKRLGIDLPAEPKKPGLLDTYRDVRDTRALRTQLGSEQNPWTGRAGAATGFGLSMLAPMPKFTPKGSGLGSKVAAGAKTGAGYGALLGLTEGGADLTKGEWGNAALETALGTILGAGAGGAGTLIAEGAQAVVPDLLKRLGVWQGRKVIQGGSDIAAATRKPLGDEAVSEVLKQGGIKPFSNTQSTYKRIDQLAEAEGAKLGQIIDDLEAQGVKGPDARKLTDEIFEEYRKRLPNTSSDESGIQPFWDEAVNIETRAAGNSNLGLKQSEAIKRDLQEAARLHRLNNSRKEEALHEISTKILKANEGAIDDAVRATGEGSKVAELGKQFVPQKGKVGNLLEARRHAELGAVKAQGRGPIGLKDYLVAGATAPANPAGAFMTAIGSAALRNRIPSAISVGSYGAGRALERAFGRAATEGAGKSAYQFSEPAMSRLRPTLTPIMADKSESEDEKIRELVEVLKAYR